MIIRIQRKGAGKSERETAMTIYELKKNTREMSFKERKEIREGCTLDQRDMEPELIASYEDKEEALAELRKYRSDIRSFSTAVGTMYLVTEFYVEENTYDEDGKFVEGGDIWDYSEMNLSNIDD